MIRIATPRKVARGFTLIELLVVIAIIAILAAILFPVFAKVREKARQSSCASNLKQLSLAVIEYLSDSDGAYPIGNSLWDQNGNWTGRNTENWTQSIQPYIKSYGTYACLDDSVGNTVNQATWWEGLRISYAVNGLNWVWSPNNHRCAGLMCMLEANQIVQENEVNMPSDVIMIAEVHSDDLIKAGRSANTSNLFNQVVSGLPWYINLAPPNNCGISSGSPGVCGPYPNGVNGAISATHNGLANFSFADGHVKAMIPAKTVPNGSSSGPFWTWGAFDHGWTGQGSLWVHDHI